MTTTRCKRFIRLGMPLIALALWASETLATLAIPDTPLFLTSTGVKPNVVMTLDDSLSMMRGYVPESVDTYLPALDGPRFKAGTFNGMYYNPSKTYPIPTRSDGVTYSTTFNSAYFNGFDTSKGTVDLRSDYKVVAQSLTDNAWSGCSNYIAANNSNYSECRLARNPDTTTANMRTCTVTFSSGNRIAPSSCSPSAFPTINATNFPTGTPVFVTGASTASNNRTYYVTGTTASYFTVTPSVSNSTSNSNVTLYWSTTTKNTNAAQAYYYLYYADKLPVATKPTNCNDNRINDACYVRVNVSSTSGPNGTDERQNFANWFSFYRTRAMAVMSGAMSAVTSLPDGTLRLGWQTTDKCKTFGTSCQGYDGTNRENRIKTLSATSRTAFHDWLQRLDLSGSTPLRDALKRAGEYYKADAHPYDSDPYVTTTPVLSCRKNYHVLLTDGLWNEDSGYTTPGGTADLDSSGSTTLPVASDTITAYTPRAPFKDVNTTAGLSSTYSNSNSLADTALYYWITDLRTGTGYDNNVTAITNDRSGDSTAQYWNPKNDPATWQHMTNFAIGLGLSSSLIADCIYNPSNLTADPNNPTPGCPVWGDSTYGGDYYALSSGSKNWPKINAAIGNDYGQEPDGHVYDLWHMAINSRGKFYSADDPIGIAAAFKDVLNTISSKAEDGGGAGLGSNATKIATDTTVYEAKFNGDWSGSLQAIPVQTAGSLGTAYWDAAGLIPSANERNIFTFYSATGQTFNSCTGSLATALNKDKNGVVDGLCTQRLAWLRGYKPVTNATWAGNTATFTVSNHGFVVGDSVGISGVTPSGYNGTYPVSSVTTNTFTVALASDPGSFSTTTTGNARYGILRDRTTSVLGDIMNSDPIYVYKEDFSYSSASVTLTGYDTYAAYVAGKASHIPVVYVGANDGMLHAFNAQTAGTNAGHEIFAYVPAGVYDNGLIDGVYHNLSALTDPLYAHQYYVDGSPTVSDVYIGDWKTYLVSGLGQGGKSVFALDITSPSSFSATNVKWEFSDATDLGFTFSQPQIAPDTGSRWVTVFGNGYNSSSDKAFLYVVDLSTGSQVAKLATDSATSNGLSTPYLFDTNGDKIVDVAYAGDLQGNLWKFVNTAGTWSDGQRLFTATKSGVAQAITSQPKVVVSDSGKRMVVFGTGRYLTTADLTDDHTQTVYAIEDDDTGTTVTVGELQPRTFTQSGLFRTVDNIATAVTSPKGWYMDFPATTGSPAERIVSAPLVKIFSTLEDRVIVTTMTPTSNPCDRGGVSHLMELKLDDGGAFSSPVIDTNGDGLINSSDTIVAGVALPSSLGITKTPLWLSGGAANSGSGFKFLTGSKGTTYSVKQTGDPDVSPGSNPVRVYWQEVR